MDHVILTQTYEPSLWWFAVPVIALAMMFVFRTMSERSKSRTKERSLSNAMIACGVASVVSFAAVAAWYTHTEEDNEITINRVTEKFGLSPVPNDSDQYVDQDGDRYDDCAPIIVSKTDTKVDVKLSCVKNGTSITMTKK